MNITDSMLFLLTLGAALACGLIGGIFFAFSNFVMTALARLEPRAGMAAMQTINITVLNPLFLFCFFGAALLAIALGGFAVLRWHQPGSCWLLGGSVMYLAGCFLATVLGNVPLNNRLAKLDPLLPESERFWRQYVVRWNFFNHVRTLACLLAAGAFTVGLSRLG